MSRANLLLAGAASLVAFVAGEGLVRLARPELLRSDGPILMASVAMVQDDAQAVRLLPRKNGRCVVWADGNVAYDTRFSTNNAGFLDDLDYPLAAGAASYAFVGDSYAAGIGGSRPWIPRLRGRTDRSVYNFSMPGTGVQHFQKALASVSPQIRIDEIVIVAISDDFFRPLWRPADDALGQRLCPPQESDADCRQRLPLFHFVPNDADVPTLARRAEAIQQAASAGRGLLRRAAKTSDLLVFAKRSIELWAQNRRRAGHLDAGIAALQAIRRDFARVPVHFIHVPDRTETRRGRYEVDPEPILRGIGAQYVPVLKRCGWSDAMFHSNDNHPNDAGYARLEECVAGHLGLGRPSSPTLGAHEASAPRR